MHDITAASLKRQHCTVFVSMSNTHPTHYACVHARAQSRMVRVHLYPVRGHAEHCVTGRTAFQREWHVVVTASLRGLRS